MHTAESICKVPADPYFELSMICCAFLIADSSGALSFFRMSIAFCAEAMASFLLPSRRPQGVAGEWLQNARKTIHYKICTVECRDKHTRRCSFLLFRRIVGTPRVLRSH